MFLTNTHNHTQCFQTFRRENLENLDFPKTLPTIIGHCQSKCVGLGIRRNFLTSDLEPFFQKFVFLGLFLVYWRLFNTVGSRSIKFADDWIRNVDHGVRSNCFTNCAITTDPTLWQVYCANHNLCTWQNCCLSKSFLFNFQGRKRFLLGCRHSSVDLSAPTILPTRVRVPSTPSTLLSFIVKFMLYLSCEKNENKQNNEAKFGSFKKCFFICL